MDLEVYVGFSAGHLYLNHCHVRLHLQNTRLKVNVLRSQMVTAEHCQLKKVHNVQNEGYIPGDSISDSSEKLLQRGRGEGQYLCDFGEGGVHAIQHIFFAEGFCQYREGYC